MQCVRNNSANTTSKSKNRKMEYDIMPQQTLPNNPDVGSYDPRRKFLSTERRTTMAPMLDKQTEERF